MNNPDDVAVLEASFNLFVEAEEQLKEYSQRIGALNREIKELRTHRDKLQDERLDLIEKCKAHVILMDGVREKVAP